MVLATTYSAPLGLILVQSNESGLHDISLHIHLSHLDFYLASLLTAVSVFSGLHSVYNHAFYNKGADRKCWK